MNFLTQLKYSKIWLMLDFFPYGKYIFLGIFARPENSAVFGFTTSFGPYDFKNQPNPKYYSNKYLTTP
jgi:hypothetical protein